MTLGPAADERSEAALLQDMEQRAVAGLAAPRRVTFDEIEQRQIPRGNLQRRSVGPHERRQRLQRAGVEAMAQLLFEHAFERRVARHVTRPAKRAGRRTELADM